MIGTIALIDLIALIIQSANQFSKIRKDNNTGYRVMALEIIGELFGIYATVSGIPKIETVTNMCYTNKQEVHKPEFVEQDYTRLFISFFYTVTSTYRRYRKLYASYVFSLTKICYDEIAEKGDAQWIQ